MMPSRQVDGDQERPFAGDDVHPLQGRVNGKSPGVANVAVGHKRQPGDEWRRATTQEHRAHSHRQQERQNPSCRSRRTQAPSCGRSRSPFPSLRSRSRSRTPASTRSTRPRGSSETRKPTGWIAPATSPIVQRRSSVASSKRIRQRAASILLRRMSRAVSGVAIRLSQVSRARSLDDPLGGHSGGDQRDQEDERRRDDTAGTG